MGFVESAVTDDDDVICAMRARNSDARPQQVCEEEMTMRTADALLGDVLSMTRQGANTRFSAA